MDSSAHVWINVPGPAGNEQQMPDWISERALMKDDRLLCENRRDLPSKHERNISTAFCAAVAPHRSRSEGRTRRLLGEMEIIK